MNYLNNKAVMKGDAVIILVSDTYIAGTVHELYERNQQIRVTGYALAVKADTAVLASDAYKALVDPILQERADQAKKDAEQ
jgi:hypothetical protein